MGLIIRLKNEPHLMEYYRGQRKIKGSKGGQHTYKELVQHLDSSHGLPKDQTKYSGWYLDLMHRSEHGVAPSQSMSGYQRDAEEAAENIHIRSHTPRTITRSHEVR